MIARENNGKKKKKKKSDQQFWNYLQKIINP